MSPILSAASKAARSRFWATFATVWLVVWLSLIPVHSLLCEAECSYSHCTTAPATGQPHAVHSCALCHLSHLPLVLTVGQGQLVSIGYLCYLAPAKAAPQTNPLPLETTPVSWRGPPHQLHFV